MGVTSMKWCDFFVWSPNGYHLERIMVDHKVVEGLLESARLFFQKCVYPRLIEGIYFLTYFLLLYITVSMK